MLTIRNARLWQLSFCGWTLFALLSVSGSYVFARSVGGHGGMAREILWDVGVAYLWAILTPFIIEFGNRFPMRRSQWRRAAAAHTLSSVVVATGVAVLIVEFSQLIRLPDPTMAFAGRVLFWIIQNLPIYFVLIALGHWSTAAEKLKDRERRALQLEAALSEARLEVLRGQLQPHFLFNTLHSISGLMHEDVDAADDMVTRLSDLLRMSLDSSGKQKTSLKRELKLLETYLSIQRRRMGSRLKVALNIDPATMDALVPSMILQPVVENAVTHGVGTRITGGTVSVTARQDGQMLHLEILDDGPGMPCDLNAKPKRGLGLANTEMRLQQLYGADHKFEVRNNREGGVQVIFAIPLRHPAADHDAMYDSVESSGLESSPASGKTE